MPKARPLLQQVGLRSANNNAKWTAQHESWNAGSSR